MNMRSYVNRVVSSCYYQMRRIRSIRRSIPTSMAVTSTNSFIIARVDYCNSFLASLPVYHTDRIQTVLNDAARLVFGGSRWNHVTPILRDRLHWLLAPQRIQFKIALLVYKVINNIVPDYITIYCRTSSTNDRRSTLRSADKAILNEPKTRTEFWRKSSSNARPQQFYQLPVSVRQSPSVDIFKTRLKNIFVF